MQLTWLVVKNQRWTNFISYRCNLLAVIYKPHFPLLALGFVASIRCDHVLIYYIWDSSIKVLETFLLCISAILEFFFRYLVLPGDVFSRLEMILYNVHCLLFKIWGKVRTCKIYVFSIDLHVTWFGIHLLLQLNIDKDF